MKESMQELYERSKEVLRDRGVTLEEIAKLVMTLQEPYSDEITMEICLDHVDAVLQKREVAHAILTGVALDELAEAKQLPHPLQEIVERDEGLYGIDEILPLSIVNLYGTIGLTSYGYLDKEKLGILKKLDTKKGVEVNTFIDDLVAALASAAASRFAHGEGNS